MNDMTNARLELCNCSGIFRNFKSPASKPYLCILIMAFHNNYSDSSIINGIFPEVSKTTHGFVKIIEIVPTSLKSTPLALKHYDLLELL